MISNVDNRRCPNIYMYTVKLGEVSESMPKVTSTDNHGGHISALAFFTVSDEKLKEYEGRLSDYLKITKEGTLKTGQSLYYGFGRCGNTFVVREGYKTVKDFFAHLVEIKEVPGPKDFEGKKLIIT